MGVTAAGLAGKEYPIVDRNSLSPSEPAQHGEARMHFLSFLSFLFFFYFFCLRGGVMGRPLLRPPVTYFCFFSAGFNIYNH